MQRGLEPRERRTIAIGATVVAVAALLALVVVPVAGRWRLREQAIAAQRERVARLTSVVDGGDAIRRRADSIERLLASGAVRLVRARSTNLAASVIQSLVRDAARSSHVTVDRLDVAGAPDASGTQGIVLPATLTAWGDIFGVSAYLQQLQHGPHLVEITEVNLTPNPMRRGSLLQLTLALRVPIALEP